MTWSLMKKAPHIPFLAGVELQAAFRLPKTTLRKGKISSNAGAAVV